VDGSPDGVAIYAPAVALIEHIDKNEQQLCDEFARGESRVFASSDLLSDGGLTDHLFVGLVDVDVSFSRRFETAPKICSIIRSAISSRKGNYMVFLPGFEYLRLVSQEFKKQNFTTQILVQKKNMSRKERDSFLQAFQSNREKTLVGFCVLGGVFAEGIDLKGDSLSGEIIVGTGFPPPSPEAEAESEAYYKREMDGKSFAYTLPGWNRVLQAAGRVIRSEEDRGFLILCDSRYCTEEIKELFPAHWEQAEILERDSELKEKLRLFWGNV
jgi:Rad3-related DNA helicase